MGRANSDWRERILRELRRGPTSIPAVSTATGISRSYVFHYFRKLLGDGVIEPCGRKPNSSGFGKPVNLFRIVSHQKYLAKAQGAGRRRKKNNGLADQIRGALKGRELRVAELATLLDAEPLPVRKALNQLMTWAGGIYGVGPHNQRRYGLVADRPTDPDELSRRAARSTKEVVAGGEFAIAGRIVIPQYRWHHVGQGRRRD